jgi:hypothetical protein
VLYTIVRILQIPSLSFPQEVQCSVFSEFGNVLVKVSQQYHPYLAFWNAASRLQFWHFLELKYNVSLLRFLNFPLPARTYPFVTMSIPTVALSGCNMSLSTRLSTVSQGSHCFVRCYWPRELAIEKSVSCYIKTKLLGLSPRTNYTDRATAACQWS